MKFHKLTVVFFAALLPWALHAEAQSKASVGKDQLANIYQVGADETLWYIASKYAIEGVSIWQFLISTYQLNPHAFVRNDISRLRVDSQLFLPSEKQITSLTPAEAEASFKQLLVGHSLPVVSHQFMTLSQIEAVKYKSTHQVRNGETLWRIATNNALDDASVWQMLMSMYQINLHAFLRKDISRLRVGSVLVMPTLNQANHLSSEVAELAYRRLLSASATPPAVRSKELDPIKAVGRSVSKVDAEADVSKSVVENAKWVAAEIASVTVKDDVQKTISPKSNPKAVESTLILKKVTIIGNESFSKDTLHSLLSDAVNTVQDLSQLEQLAARITRFYQDQGYSLASAVIPAQVIRGGDVTIQVIEAKYGQVNLTNNGRVSDDFLAAAAGSMRAGTVISDANLNASLLLLSDVPGIVVSASLSPGSSVGSTNVILDVEDSQPYFGSLSVDQYGDENIGKEQVSGSLAVNNLAGHGDVLTASGVFSSADMKFGRLSYDWLLNGDGVHIGAAYSGLNYAVGKELESAEIDGSVRTGSVWIIRPLLRSLDANVSAQVQYDVNQLKDHRLSTRMDRTISAVSLIVTGDQQNAYGLGGLGSWTFRLKRGDLRFDDSAAESFDAGSAVTRGGFEKINLNITNIQRVSDKARIYFNASWQLASSNLDSSDKLSAGGLGAVRAYKSGVLTGDTGYVGSVEFRYYLAEAFDGRLTGSFFYDSANVTVNKVPWQGLTSANSASISGAGAGLEWIGPQQVSAKLDIAVPTGPASALVANRPSLNLWLKMTKGF